MNSRAPRPETCISPRTKPQQKIKVVQAPVDPVLIRSIDMMQQSYEKNLGVIEKLYKEKMDMKERIDQLEQKLGITDPGLAGPINDELEDALATTKLSLERDQDQAMKVGFFVQYDAVIIFFPNILCLCHSFPRCYSFVHTSVCCIPYTLGYSGADAFGGRLNV